MSNITIETKKFHVTETVVEGTSYKEVLNKSKDLSDDGFSCSAINIGYKTGEEDSKVYWFKATLKIEIKTI